MLEIDIVYKLFLISLSRIYFYIIGESTNAEGMLVMCIFMTEDSPPTLKFWKHGMVQEELVSMHANIREDDI